MTDVPSRNTRDATFLVVGQLLSSACALLTTVAVARAIGPTGKGYYDIIVNAGALLVTFSSVSISSGAFYLAAAGRLRHHALIRWVLPAALALGVLITTLFGAAGERRGLAWLLPGPASTTPAILVGALVVATHAQLVAQAILRGFGRFRTFAVTDVMSRGGALLIILLLALAGVSRPAWYAIGFVGATAAAAVVAVGAAWRIPRIPNASAGLSEVVRYSLPLFVGNAAQFLNYRLDVFFVQHYVGLTGVGVYTVAVSIAQMLWLVPNALASLVMRLSAAESDRGALERQVALVARFCFWLTVATALALAGIAAVGMVGVFGRGFHGSIRPLFLLLPGVVLFSQTVILSAYLNGLARQMDTTIVACGSLVLTVVLDLLLIPRHGVSGAAVASSVSYAASCLATIIAVRYRTPRISWISLVVPQSGDLSRLKRLTAQGWRRATTLLRPRPV